VPELPEVETVKTALMPVIEGRRIRSVRLTRTDLRWKLPDRLEERLTGQTCGVLGRRGKYILVPLSSGESLLIHLGMSGSIRLYDSQPQFGKHDHFAAEMESGDWFVFSDPRRFGHLDLLVTGEEEKHPLLANLGVEPLSNAFSAQLLMDRFQGRKQAVKTALLDQRLIAGLGNIYVSEALFDSAISPRRQAGTIKSARAQRLATSIVGVLRAAIAQGGTSLRDHIQPGGEIGYFVQKLAVYGRSGMPCPRCARPIKEIRQAGRSSFYCSSCQR